MLLINEVIMIEHGNMIEIWNFVFFLHLTFADDFELSGVLFALQMNNVFTVINKIKAFTIIPYIEAIAILALSLINTQVSFLVVF